MSKDYEVGYAKPPKHTQFPKGQSGNPKGKPKGSKNFKTDVKDTLKEPVRLNSGGKRKNVSTQQATLLRLREKALSGDARALDKMIDLARTYNDEEFSEDSATLSLTDAEIVEAHNQRLLRRTEKLPPDDDEDGRDDTAQVPDAPDEDNDPPEEEDDDAWLR